MGQQDENGVIKSSEEHESSENLETSGKPESSETLETSEKPESSEKLEPLEKHESSSPPSSSRENETTEADDQENFKSLKPKEHQGGPPLETDNLVSEESEKLAETNIEEPKSITEKPVGSNIGISEEATTTATNEIETESNVNSAEQLEFQHKEFGSSKDLKSKNADDQVVGNAHEPIEMNDGIDLQKTEEEAEREVSGLRNEAESDVKVSDDVAKMVVEVVNTSAKVEIADGEHEADKSEQQERFGSDLCDDAGSVVELEKVKKEMKSMEAALLGAARQAQVHNLCQTWKI